jgi:linoleoyl-CoA desaturase
MAFMSGNLCYQIEHHLYPDLPSNRYAEIGVRIRQLCEKYDLPYTTGSLHRQYWQTFRTIAKLSLPDRFLTATADDAPETASEHKFAGLRAAAAESGKRLAAAGEDRREGLKTAIAEVRARRNAVHAS